MPKNAFDFAVSLRATHPSWAADVLAERVGLAPKRCWSVGDPRTTPKGTPLGGVRDHSYCTFDIAAGDDGGIAQALREAVSSLRARKSELNAIRSSGGMLGFFVFWQANGDNGEEFDIDLITGLAELGIDIGINVIA